MTFEQMSHDTSNLGLKFWWWALETITHRIYPHEGLIKTGKVISLAPYCLLYSQIPAAQEGDFMSVNQPRSQM
jgi:hypothetical protein